jgi:hypothetical protein
VFSCTNDTPDPISERHPHPLRNTGLKSAGEAACARRD